MPLQIGLFTHTDQDRWHWGDQVVQTGHLVTNYVQDHQDTGTPSTWIIVLPPYLPPRSCTILAELSTRVLLITSRMIEGLDAMRRRQYPFCVAHPRVAQLYLAQYIELIQHLTSGRLVFTP